MRLGGRGKQSTNINGGRDSSNGRPNKGQHNTPYNTYKCNLKI